MQLALPAFYPATIGKQRKYLKLKSLIEIPPPVIIQNVRGLPFVSILSNVLASQRKMKKGPR